MTHLRTHTSSGISEHIGLASGRAGLTDVSSLHFPLKIPKDRFSLSSELDTSRHPLISGYVNAPRTAYKLQTTSSLKGSLTHTMERETGDSSMGFHHQFRMLFILFDTIEEHL